MNEMHGLLTTEYSMGASLLDFLFLFSCHSPVMIHDGGGLETSERLQHINIWFVNCILAQVTHIPSSNMASIKKQRIVQDNQVGKNALFEFNIRGPNPWSAIPSLPRIASFWETKKASILGVNSLQNAVCSSPSMISNLPS